MRSIEEINEMKSLEIERLVKEVDYNEKSYNARTLYRMVENGDVSFDNTVQRCLVWDNKRKSLLIHSLLMGIPVPPMLALEDGEHLDMLDGKQRVLGAITGFYRGEYKLEGVDDIRIRLKNGTYDEMNVNGLKYDDLHDILKETIDNYSFHFFLLKDSTLEEWVNQMFFRWNNGKSLTNVELTRATAKSQKQIMKLAAHELFEHSLTQKAREGYKNEDIVLKSYVMLNEEEPALETKDLRKITPTLDITDVDAEELDKIFTRVCETHDYIANEAVETDGDEKVAKKKISENEKIAKKIFSKTNLISIVPFVQKSILDNLSVPEFADWFRKFFAVKQKGASINATYNECIKAGSMKKVSIKKRGDVLETHYKDWYKRLMADKKNGIEIVAHKMREDVVAEEEAAVIEETPVVEDVAVVAEPVIAEELAVETELAVIEEAAVETEITKEELESENTNKEETITNEVASMVDELVAAVEAKNEEEFGGMNMPEVA